MSGSSSSKLSGIISCPFKRDDELAKAKAQMATMARQIDTLTTIVEEVRKNPPQVHAATEHAEDRVATRAAQRQSKQEMPEPEDAEVIKKNVKNLDDVFQKKLQAARRKISDE